MQLVYEVGLALIAVFSLACGWYLTRFQFDIRGAVLRGCAFLALSGGVFAATLTATVFLVWLPILPL